MGKIPVGILGATGIVGQRMIQLLDGHPWFDLKVVSSSPTRDGQRLEQCNVWCLERPMPESVKSLTMQPMKPASFESCAILFSALDKKIAAEIEPELTTAGKVVISNSSAFRMDPRVPLIIPEINADQLNRLEQQPWDGSLITNPNCSVMGLAIALAPLQQAIGIDAIVVSTLQAVSGAGRNGPSVLGLTDNVIPFIANEEGKIAEEYRRIFANPKGDQWEDLTTPVAAHCHRVPVIDGHLESVSIKLKSKLSADEAKRLLLDWKAHPASRKLPSSPQRPIWVSDAEDRPQPRLDRDTDRGMAVTVGRIRPCPVFDLRLVLLSHNAIRGAAGAAILNAELAVKQNIVASSIS